MPDIKHTDAYYANSDIDWFVRLNGCNIHVASTGRMIPEKIVSSLPEVYKQVSDIEMAPWSNEGVWYNEKLLKSWLHLERDMEIARYLATFVVMARKGFYSFAPITFDATDDNYFLMAKPMPYVDRDIKGIVNGENTPFNINEVQEFTPVRLVEWI